MSRAHEAELKAILVRFWHEGELSPQAQRLVVGAAAELALSVFHTWRRHRGYRLDESDIGFGTTLVAPLFASEPEFPMLRRATISGLGESAEDVLGRFRAAVVRTARQGISRLVGELGPEGRRVRRLVQLAAKKHALHQDGFRIYFRESDDEVLDGLPSERHIQLLRERCGHRSKVRDLVLATRDILAHERGFAACFEVNQLVADYLAFYIVYMPQVPEGVAVSPDAGLDAGRVRGRWPGVRERLESEIRDRRGDDPARLNGHRDVLSAVQDAIEDLLADGHEEPHWTYMRKYFPGMTAASYRESPLRGVFLRLRAKALSYLRLPSS